MWIIKHVFKGLLSGKTYRFLLMSITKTIKGFLTILVLALFIVACGDDTNLLNDYSNAPDLPDTTATVSKVISESGLIYYVIKEGDPESFDVVIRDNVYLFYTGRTISNGEIFESSYENGNTSSVRFINLGTYSTPTTRGAANKGEGFVEGIVGMKEGERRVLVIDSELNNTSVDLIYDIEVDFIDY